MTYGYEEATAVVGPLSPVALPGAYDLCADHARSVTVPVGWQLIQLVTEFEPVEPSTDDLTALADAIREASKRDVPPPQVAQREFRRADTDVTSRPHVRPQFSVIAGGAEDSEQRGADLSSVTRDSKD